MSHDADVETIIARYARQMASTNSIRKFSIAKQQKRLRTILTKLQKKERVNAQQYTTNDAKKEIIQRFIAQVTDRQSLEITRNLIRAIQQRDQRTF